MSQFWEDDIVGTKPPLNIGLFAPRTVSTASMAGAGQVSRDEARSRQSVDATYARIVRVLELHGPMTRKELAEATGIPVNTINARTAELRSQQRVYTEGRRNGESIVRLAGAA